MESTSNLSSHNYPGQTHTVPPEGTEVAGISSGTCDSPPRLSFAELPGVVNNSYPVGTELKYSCRPGYILGSGKSPLVTCLENSTWSVDPEFCVGRSCKQLELENGRVDLTDLRFGATATFSCNGGYRLIGTTSAQCVAVGNGVDWDKELPHCDVIITQDKPTTVPPEGAEVAETSSGSDLNTAGNSAEPEGGALVIITQDKPTTVPPERAEVSGTSSELGFYTHIGIPSICITFAIGIVAALNKIWQKKKGSYNVNPDSPKYQITTT